MKPLIGFALLLFISITSFSQGKFWGTVYGDYGTGGMVYRFSADGTQPEILKTFEQFDGNGENPRAATMYQASDGKFYGVTEFGGKYFGGTLFSFDRASNKITKVYDFKDDLANGGPFGALVETGGYLYGYIGLSPVSVYSIKKDGTDFKVLTSPFEILIGALNGSLATGMDGNLYGFSSVINSADGGFVFKLTPSGVFTKVKTLASNTAPFGTPWPSSSGKLYGILNAGFYRLFTINSDGTGYAESNYPAGADPGNYVLQSTTGDFFGTIHLTNGKDKLYKFGSNLAGYTEVFEFPAGLRPLSRIAFKDNVIYGAANDGNGQAVIFKIDISGSNYKELLRLDTKTGKNPGGITLGSDNVLYIINTESGILDLGSIATVKIDGTGSTSQDLAVPCDGSIPGMHLRQLTDGGVMGVTGAGGSFGNGTIFTFDSNDQYKVVHNFNVDDGSVPLDAPVAGKDGFYYGSTTAGGDNDAGVIYKVRADGTQFTKLFDFGGANGVGPYSSLTYVDEKLYGTTRYGGANDKGVIFKINADGTGFQKLLDFSGPNGNEPSFSSLAYGQDGYLYGCADGGNNFDGIVYKVKTDGTGYQKIFDLENSGYELPNGDPVIDTNGDIIVSADRGGAKDHGAVLRVKANGSGYTVLHEFDVTLPSYSFTLSGNLITGPDGLLWGVEPNGGSNGTGTVFKMNKDGSNYTRIEMNLNDGGLNYMSPWYGLLYVPNSVVAKQNQVITFPEIGAHTLGDAPFDTNASVSSGLPLNYSVGTDRISITNGKVTMNAAGRALIIVSQPGNASYNPAENVTRGFCIKPVKPTITVKESPTVLSSGSDNGNQWYVDGTLIANATNKTFTPTKDGAYSVTTKVDDCVSVMSDNSVVKLPATITGLEDINSSIELYPNPATNEIFITVGKISSVNVFDLNGRVVLTSTEKQISITSLSKGIYFVRIAIDNNVITKRLVKL